MADADESSDTVRGMTQAVVAEIAELIADWYTHVPADQSDRELARLVINHLAYGLCGKPLPHNRVCVLWPGHADPCQSYIFKRWLSDGH
ncbi:MAG TPA: hypothetical protein VF163_03635 [Micromonosporaceae bacterium]